MRYRRRFLFLTIVASLSADPSAPDNTAAIALYREKKNDDARAAFETLIAADPKNAEAFHYLGRIAAREKRDDDALRLHETATTLAPENSAYWIALGDAFGRKATTASLFSKLTWAKKCRAALEKAVALDSTSAEAQTAIIEFYRRAPEIAGGGIQKAYTQALAFREIDLPAGTALLAALYERESKFPELFAALDRALATHPDHYALLASYGRAAAASGENRERGRTALQHCLTLTPPPGAPDHAAIRVLIEKIDTD